MKEIDASKDYELTNGLGTITFSAALFEQTIRKVLDAYPSYKYEKHSINNIDNNYLEVSLTVKTPNKFDLKVIDQIQRDLLTVLKQSLSLNCLLAINIDYAK